MTCASAVQLHGLTCVQMYQHNSDWAIPRKIKEAVNMPIISNAGVTSNELVEKMLKEIAVDAFMVGRDA
ncbi:hypothetical protein DV965_17505 [Staphylococcus pseudintermedius]|uniref:tRNA-dihydrouridine synthase n=1 Tax=Staphylococcus pseudintermedius TaxID=283734 RepID=UPI000E3683F1|nr:tRNA-dihydrouridine synthase [Staphylococcus pseudintermedius]REB90370.1 hypothetical protein DV965_17505 [Staphylococcus pseudintermedius]